MKKQITALFVAAIMLAGCEKYVDNAQMPAGMIAGTEAFVSDNAVSAIVTGNFLNLTSSGVFSGGSASNMSFLMGLYTDELTSIATSNTTAVTYYKNAIISGTSTFWGNQYSKIYAVNAAIEGIQATNAVLYNKNQWLGECYFTRALLYYYLVNFYGDVPLALTSDYAVNSKLPRSPVSNVYQQIIADLKEAQSLLSDDYKDGYGVKTDARVRPNKAAATAFLAKVYLYTEQWELAEAAATSIISNTAYKLMPLNQVFIASNTTNKEAIWSLATKADERVYDYGFYNNGMPAVITKDPASGYTVLVSMSPSLYNSFEAGDRRVTNWTRTSVNTSITPNVTYNFPDKFKSNVVGAERLPLLRLAEIYLVRAEARAQRDKVSDGRSDLDSVRLRAGLSVATAGNKPDLITAITRERRVELFTEGCSRFFDLKRTGTINTVMNLEAPKKGATWDTFRQLLPIPEADMRLNPAITPNLGY